jgi:ATP-dependent DNA ligase
LRNLPGPGSIARGDRRDLTARPLRDRGARLEDVVAGSELVFPVRRLAADGLEAWKQVVERGYEGYVAKDEATWTTAGRGGGGVQQKELDGSRKDRWQRRIGTGVRACHRRARARAAV